MKIDKIKVYGIRESLRSMRNPLNSWHLSDSIISGTVGEKDAKLSRKLTKAGSEHCKHLRLIQVWMDIEAPRYWWAEMDTYRFLEKVSCSTIHKLFENKLTLADFEGGEDLGYLLIDTIVELNRMRDEYLKTKDNNTLIKAKRILPESFLQKRTINTNYQQLLNIYNQRKSHKLPEWQVMCDEILRLEHFKKLTGVDGYE